MFAHRYRKTAGLLQRGGLKSSRLRPPLRPIRAHRGRGLGGWSGAGWAGQGGEGQVHRSTSSALPGPTRCSSVRPALPLRTALDSAVMSTAMNFGTKSFQPRPPDKGSFPLDHFGEARLRLPVARDWVAGQLMAPEPLEKLGFRDVMDEKPETKDKC
ncbi:Cytochrome c oxidase assembly protein COX19 [Lemmus lemmus]